LDCPCKASAYNCMLCALAELFIQLPSRALSSAQFPLQHVCTLLFFAVFVFNLTQKLTPIKLNAAQKKTNVFASF